MLLNKLLTARIEASAKAVAQWANEQFPHATPFTPERISKLAPPVLKALVTVEGLLGEGALATSSNPQPATARNLLMEWQVPDKDEDDSDDDEEGVHCLMDYPLIRSLLEGHITGENGLNLAADFDVTSDDHKVTRRVIRELLAEVQDTLDPGSKSGEDQRFTMVLMRTEDSLEEAINDGLLTAKDVAAGPNLSERGLTRHILDLSKKFKRASGERAREASADAKKDKPASPAGKAAAVKFIKKVTSGTPAAGALTAAQASLIVGGDSFNASAREQFAQLQEFAEALLDGSGLEQYGVSEKLSDQQVTAILAKLYLGEQIDLSVETNQKDQYGNPVFAQVAVTVPEISAELYLLLRSEPLQTGAGELLGTVKDYYTVITQYLVDILTRGKPQLDQRLLKLSVKRIIIRRYYGPLSITQSGAQYKNDQLDLVELAAQILHAVIQPTDTQLLQLEVLKRDQATPSLKRVDGTSYRPPYGFSSAAARILIELIGPVIPAVEGGGDTLGEYATTLEFYERYKVSSEKRGRARAYLTTAEFFPLGHRSTPQATT